MFKAKLSIQKNGSTLLVLLEGAQNEIVDAFNSLYNWGAVGDIYDGDTCLDFLNESRDKAQCWSTPKKLRQYFYMRHLCAAEDANGLVGSAPFSMRCKAWLDAKETFMKLLSTPFHCPRREYVAERSMGTISAEKPDDCFRDYIVTRAHQARE